MDADWATFRKRPVRARLIEKRRGLLSAFLSEHRLADPKSIEFSPLVDCVEARCFTNVEAQVNRAGGKMETGWVFWELENVSIYTEAHAIWITPPGRRRDITPRSMPPDRRLLFLPDQRVALKRGYTAGYRTTISTDPRVRAIDSYITELARIFDECFVGMGKEMSIPVSRVRESAQQLGLPTEVAMQIFEDKVHNFSS